MEESGVEFPGFQTNCHRDEFVFRRSMNPRLQKQAPGPLQIKPNVSFACNATNSSMNVSSTSSSSTSSSFSSSFFNNKDPIPLLSPLVVFESKCIREENTAKSH
ncbi:hypothetical protein L6164_026995 [Bauhinia variegata]|uniref:Uncharacterized protein n=1 Tax=Bauhinia variegata TaxID=167791 RepID=A0ACB9LSS9_BAUVA|nr:hypothetical protein L6164_026995 [Bauhinia variegata]